MLKQAPKHLSPSLSVSSKTYDPPQMGAQKTLALPLNLPALPPPPIINDRSLTVVGSKKTILTYFLKRNSFHLLMIQDGFLGKV